MRMQEWGEGQRERKERISSRFLIGCRVRQYLDLTLLRSSFGMIYDSLDYARRNEPKFARQTCRSWPVEEDKDLKKTAKGPQKRNKESQVSEFWYTQGCLCSFKWIFKF